METLVHGLQWAQTNYSLFVGLVGGSFGLSVFLEVALHKLQVKYGIDNKKLSFLLLQALSLLSGFSTWGITHISGKEAAGIYGAVFMACSTWHRFVVSDAYKKYVLTYVQWLASQKTATVSPAPVTVVSPTEATPVAGQ